MGRAWAADVRRRVDLPASRGEASSAEAAPSARTGTPAGHAAAPSGHIAALGGHAAAAFSRGRGIVFAALMALALGWLEAGVGATAHAQALPGSGSGGLPGVSAGQPQFLRVDEAFVLRTRLDGTTLVADWRIADGYYLYRSRTTLTPEAGSDVRVGEAVFPAGKHKTDDYFGDVEVYYQGLQVRQPLLAGSAGARVKITYQGCADAGLCYPPTTKWFVLPAAVAQAAAPGASAGGPGGGATADASPAVPDPGVRAGTPAAPPFVPLPATPVEAGAAPPDAVPVAIGTAAGVIPPNANVRAAAGPEGEAGTAAPPAGSGEEHALAALLSGGSALTALGLFFLAGVGLAFTPCVLPMVPILSSIVVGQGGGTSRRRAFTLSLAYVLGMALTYAALGTVVGLFGGEFNLQARLQSPPVLVVSAAIFVLLALSMFGLYELQLPSWLLQRLNAVSARQQGGRLGSVAVMGALSALIVSPCVSAPLVGALLYLSSTGDAVLGGLALLALGLGMGVPLLAVGVGGAGLLPRAGAWMDRVKAVFGFLLLGVAVWLLERLLPGPLTLLLWAALAIGAGVFLGAFDRRDERNGGARLAQATGVLLLVWGVLLSVGAASGASDPLRPLGRLAESRAAGDAAGAASHAEFVDVRGLPQVRAAIAAAAQAGQPVLLDLYADWCIACKVMEREVFPVAEVQASMSRFALLRVDVTANDELDRALLAEYGLFGPPSMLFFDATGRERTEFRVQGERNAAEFAAHLQRVLAGT